MAIAQPVNILMVDDRPENLLALEAILDTLGQNLVRATSGEEALKSLLKQDFALILMDVQMPDMNGIEVATLIKQREKNRHTPIIFLTAINKDQGHLFEGYSAGAVDYLFKPFDPVLLRSKVAVFIDLYRKTETIKAQAERLRIVEAREAQQQMAALTAENELRYRNLADSIPALVWTTSPDGRFNYFNRRWVQYTGRSNTADSQAWHDVVHPDDVGPNVSSWTAALQTGEPATFEGRVRRWSDGAYRWHQIQIVPDRAADGTITGWLGIATDIDDRMRAQTQLESRNREVEAEVAARTRELAAQKRFVERLIDSAPAGIAYVDRDLAFRLVNPEFARFVGLRTEAIVDRPAGEVFADQAALFEPLLRAVLDTGEPHRAVGFPFPNARAPEPAPTFWDIVYYPVTNEAEGIEGVLVFSLEVSDRVENERLQHDQIEQLREVDTLKDEFLSVISHELRTPLNFIMGFASILSDEVAGPLSPDQQTYLEKILNGTDRMLLLVNDLLDFAKLQAGEFDLFIQPQAYRPLVEEVLTTLKPLADHKRIALQLSVPDDLCASCDPQRVIQVLTNLVGNAIKFTPEDGIVLVSADVEAATVVTRVEDTGIGIAPENLDKLFTRFRQLDMSRTREAGGTGLGLSISKALVEAHGGRIWADSQGLGQGATFRFSLPTVEAGAALSEGHAAPAGGKA